MIIGYFFGILMGLVLGLLGGGGSILTVPIITYLFKVPALQATSYSLFIVGVSALFGASRYMKQGLIDYRTGLFFSLPAFLSIYFVRQILLGYIPYELNIFGLISLNKNNLIMIVFAVVMLVASVSMIKGRKDSEESIGKPVIFLILQGAFVGCVTGFVGAGGGFIIIPGLVLFAGLKMKKAVGTSLLIISINSLFGFSSDILGGANINWPFLLKFTGVGIIGVFLGTYFSQKVSNKRLKPLFGWMVLAAGSLILLKELFS